MISPYAKAKLFIEDELTIIDKTGTEIPFVLNSIQNKFEETLRKQLNRETTNPVTLQAYLDIMIQDSKFKSLHMTIPKPLVTSILDKDIIDGLAHISKKITQKLEADI